jgi:hypothetical protein
VAGLEKYSLKYISVPNRDKYFRPRRAKDLYTSEYFVEGVHFLFFSAYGWTYIPGMLVQEATLLKYFWWMDAITLPKRAAKFMMLPSECRVSSET